jgi:hypothetical protein
MYVCQAPKWLYLLLKLGLPEQAVEWLPLRLGLVVEDKPTEFHVHVQCHVCTFTLLLGVYIQWNL